MRSSELFRRRLVVIVLCCTFFVAVWRCVVTYARKTKEICVESTSVHANHFPLGKQTTNKTSSSSSSRFIRRKNQTRERERETPAKNDDQNASSLLLSERGMDVPCETLSQTRSFVCTQHSRWWVFCLLFFFLCFIFRVSKKKRKKRRGEKGRGLCHSLLRAFVRSLRSRLFPPKALTTTTTTRFVRGGGGGG